MNRDDRHLLLAKLSLGSTTATIGLVLALSAGLRYDWIIVGLGLIIAWLSCRQAWSAYTELRDA